MTQYKVGDNTTCEMETFYRVGDAKSWMKSHLKLGHEVWGTKTKIYSTGEWIPCGDISLTGSNKTFITNTKMMQANY